MRVFDISYWQPSNTIDKIINLGADGVILRLGLTYGGVPELDTKFTYFLSQARANNLPVGIYYYSKLRSRDQALMEAQFINDQVWNFWQGGEPEMGVWWDMEDKTTTNKYTYDDLISAIETMQGWGFNKLGIYASYSYFKEWMDMADLERRQLGIWVAHYGTNTNWLKKEYPNLNWYGWQFTEAYDGNSLDGNDWYKI